MFKNTVFFICIHLQPFCSNGSIQLFLEQSQRCELMLLQSELGPLKLPYTRSHRSVFCSRAFII